MATSFEKVVTSTELNRAKSLLEDFRPRNKESEKYRHWLEIRAAIAAATEIILAEFATGPEPDYNPLKRHGDSGYSGGCTKLAVPA